MKFKLSVLALVVVSTGLAATPIAAAPMASPCIAGASYHPTCDVNQDGAINILDVQLTAGHWNRTGTFVSDNNHTHLGQTWTGANNPLKLQGPFGAPDYAPIVLSNTQGHGLAIPTASIDGIYVGTAGAYGIVVNDAAQDGVYVGSAGDPTSNPASGESNGFEVAGAFAAGARLTAAADGAARPLGTIQVQLAGGEGTADLPENAPVIGVALEAAKDGLVWVLVNPQ